jgi:asparagine synthase (glutamine-hydrolysing)
MCGIVGLFDSSITKDCLFQRVQEATVALKHRGPDNFGIYVDDSGRFALGHTRLSIIDPSSAGNQPMLSKNRDFVIVYNGEIYNYKDLYKRFCPNDGTVNANSDTSVLLHIFSKLGTECLNELDGMFAFAIVEGNKSSVFLARDRFGEKPLYWMKEPNRFAFSSELHALKRLTPDFEWKMSSKSLALYHVLGSVPPPHTIYENVYALRPGFWMKLNLKGESIEKCYWSISSTIKERTDIPDTYEEAKSGILFHLCQAVKSRMVSDVPVGVFLSGGYDSSAILAICALQNILPAKTLCIDFKEDTFSEFETAQATANKFGIALEKHTVDENWFMESLPNYFRSMDQPTIDGYNTYFVAEAAKEQGLKVWLSGIGGDEVFGGYPSFYRLKKLEFLSGLLQIPIRPWILSRLATRLQSYLKLSRVLHLGLTGNQSVRAYQCCRNQIPYYNMSKILHPDLRMSDEEFNSILNSIYPVLAPSFDIHQKASILEAAIYMGSQLLRDIDNFSMIHSLELRAPFLDDKLFSYVLNIPTSFKKKSPKFKSLLVDSLGDLLPKEVTIQGKRGFTFPIEKWILKGLKHSFEEYVLNSDNNIFWDMKTVRSMWGSLVAGKIHWGVLWNLYALARWRVDKC